jgi:hypothetical protein
MTDTTLDPNDAGATDTWDDLESSDFDVTDLRVNFSTEEAEATSFDNLPPGKYHVIISDVKVKTSNSAKNKGKPYYAMTVTVVAPDKYAKRKLFTNIMLFPPALYSLSFLMKALGYPVSAGEVKVPTPDELVGQEFIATVKITPPRTDPETGKTYDARNEIKGFAPVKSRVDTSGNDSLDP